MPPPRPQLPAGSQPLFAAAALFSLGIVIGKYAWRPEVWWVAGALVVLVAAAMLLRQRLRCSAALAGLALVMAGALAFELRPAPDAAPAEVAAFCDGREVLVTAHVVRDSVTRPGAFGGERQVVDVEAEQLRDGESFTATPAGLRVSIYPPSAREEDDDDQAARRPLVYGQRLRFTAKLRLPRNFETPGALDYRGYLHEKGIAALGSARSDSVELLPGFSGSRLARWRSAVRRSLLDQMAELWNKQDVALVAAMVLGDDSAIERPTRVDFQRTGVYHVLVVSGLNVGILAFFLLWVLRLVRVPEMPATAVAVVSAALYAYLTDLGAPILRAALMLAVYLGARLLNRERAGLNAIGAAALALLVAEPRILFDASFQLTFLSVAAIAAIGVPLLERTSGPYRKALANLDCEPFDLALPPRAAQFRLDLRMLGERLEKLLPFVRGRAASILVACARAALGLYDVLAISALMQVALALPMAVWFHRVTVFGLPANAVIVPLTGLMLPLAVVALALGYVSSALAWLPAVLTAASVHGMTFITTHLGRSRAGDFRLPDPSTAAALFAGAALILAAWSARRRRAWALAGLGALAASALWITALPPQPRLHPGALEITMLDVGQAESMLVVTPEGRTLLVDAGGSFGDSASEFDYGESLVSPYLWSRGIARLDAVLLTHGHSDHIGGMGSVLANFHPSELWVGKNPATGAYRALLRQASGQDTAVITRLAGDAFDLGGAHFEVLSPPRDWSVGKQPRNNDSVVIRIGYGATSALLEADAEKKIERWLATEQPHADLLKVAHNGSATSTTPEFLQAVEPRYALISVGYKNRFGHPRGEVLERLAEQRVATYRTDAEGTLTFLLDGRRVTPMPPDRP